MERFGETSSVSMVTRKMPDRKIQNVQNFELSEQKKVFITIFDKDLQDVSSVAEFSDYYRSVFHKLWYSDT